MLPPAASRYHYEDLACPTVNNHSNSIIAVVITVVIAVARATSQYSAVCTSLFLSEKPEPYNCMILVVRTVERVA
jgi:hypothetical protein